MKTDFKSGTEGAWGGDVKEAMIRIRSDPRREITLTGIYI
jgi:hypothetical protein